LKRFVLSELALADLEEIWNYIAKADKRAADRVKREIKAAIRKLVQMPTLGHEHPLIPSEDLRVWPVDSYLIIYLPDSRPLQVARILHASRDLSRLFGSEDPS
jgi:antitoxin ParD1/3/4/toxin ParE1/3/4